MINSTQSTVFFFLIKQAYQVPDPLMWNTIAYAMGDRYQTFPWVAHIVERQRYTIYLRNKVGSSKSYTSGTDMVLGESRRGIRDPKVHEAMWLK